MSTPPQRIISSSFASGWSEPAKSAVPRREGRWREKWPTNSTMLPSFPILDLLQDCCDPPLTTATLDALQGRLGKRFPPEYANFLLQFNGGHFKRSVESSIPNPTKFVTGGLVRSFIGEPNDGYEKNGLVWNAEIRSDLIPSEFLPIADCNFNDYVVLKLVGPESRFEGVWHWDCAPIDDYPAFYWLADSFYEFLSMLAYDVCAYEEERETLPLFQAIQRGAMTAIEQHLAQGGDVDARNEQGHTLLMAAAWHQWPRIVRLLLNHSADPNARDNSGKTPLHHAAVSSVDSVKLLFAAGADAAARDNEGKSVLGEWSYRADQILRAHGAKE